MQLMNVLSDGGTRFLVNPSAITAVAETGEDTCRIIVRELGGIAVHMDLDRMQEWIEDAANGARERSAE